MYLQGNLQELFDALYQLGIIDPILKMDWAKALDELPNHLEEFTKIVQAANIHQGDMQHLMGELEKFDESALNYLAMEVAREFADYHTRETIH